MGERGGWGVGDVGERVVVRAVLIGGEGGE